MKIQKIRKDLQPEIDKVIKQLLANSKYSAIRIKGHIVDQVCGKAYWYLSNTFTVPLWAYDRRYKGQIQGREGYFTYYVAHEIAHILRDRKYGNQGNLHDEKFYEMFTSICPLELQHIELEYKPTARKYGIPVPWYME